MADTMLARIRPGKKGFKVKRYMYGGTLYVAEKGWYEVGPAVAERLTKLHQDDQDPDSPLLFDVCTREEALRLEEEEREREEREKKASVSRPNRVSSPSRAITERQRTRQGGGDLSSGDLPQNQKDEPMLDPDPDGEEVEKTPDEGEGVVPVGRVEGDAKEPARSAGGRRAAKPAKK